jgi:hypothetical protein
MHRLTRNEARRQRLRNLQPAPRPSSRCPRAIGQLRLFSHVYRGRVVPTPPPVVSQQRCNRDHLKFIHDLESPMVQPHCGRRRTCPPQWHGSGSVAFIRVTSHTRQVASGLPSASRVLFCETERTDRKGAGRRPLPGGDLPGTMGDIERNPRCQHGTSNMSKISGELRKMSFNDAPFTRSPDLSAWLKIIKPSRCSQAPLVMEPQPLRGHVRRSDHERVSLTVDAPPPVAFSLPTNSGHRAPMRGFGPRARGQVEERPSISENSPSSDRRL